MDKIYTIGLMLFLIITGLGQCGAGLPRWVVIVGGVGGILAGLILLIGLV
jgi:hypothetical protein